MVKATGLNAVTKLSRPSAPMSSQTARPIAHPTTVPRDQVAMNPINPRALFRSLNDLDGLRPLVAEDLLVTIPKMGQTQNVVVVTRQAFLEVFPHLDGAVGPAAYVVVDGSRRRAAIEILGLPTIRITVDNHLVESEYVFRRAAVSTNLNRRDLSPLDAAYELDYLFRERGGTKKDLAAELGTSPAFVTQHLQLLELPERKQAEMRAGTLTFSAARSWLAGERRELGAEGGGAEVGTSAATVIDLRGKSGPSTTAPEGRPPRQGRGRPKTGGKPVVIPFDATPEAVAEATVRRFSDDPAALRELVALLAERVGITTGEG